MKKICMLLASSTLAFGIAGCNEGNTGQASQIKNQNEASKTIANVKARRAYFSSDDNYEKAFKQKFGSEVIRDRPKFCVIPKILVNYIT